MKYHALTHYLLVVSLIFASSFTAFHGSEHVNSGSSTPNSHGAFNYIGAKANQTHSHINFANHHANAHSEHSHHASHFDKTQTRDHTHNKQHGGIDQLCKTCLVLSTLIAAIHSPAFDIESKKAQNRSSHYTFVTQQDARHNYLSRAPPVKT